jgi:hypothetical protein
MIEETYIWLLLAYVAGSGIGWYLGQQKRTEDIVIAVIDDLIEKDFIKTKSDENNEIELLKYWED